MSQETVGAIHVHSQYSHDGRDSLEELREFGVQRGLSFLALSDHAEDLDEKMFAEFIARCAELTDRRLQLIPGLEYRFAGYPGLHLLALGLSRYLSPDTPGDFFVQASKHARMTILAHPVLCRYDIPSEVLATVHGVEVWNAAYNTRYLPDPRSIRILHKMRRCRPDVVGTVGLDQHDSRNDREVRIVLDDSTKDPIAEIKAGRFTNRGQTMSFGPAVSWRPGKLVAMSALRWGYDRIERTQERIARSAKEFRLRSRRAHDVINPATRRK